MNVDVGAADGSTYLVSKPAGHMVLAEEGGTPLLGGGDEGGAGGVGTDRSRHRHASSSSSAHEVFQHAGLGRFNRSFSGDGMTRSPGVERGGSSHKSLNLICLVVLIFYSVSGGPFGVESAVGAAGPFLTLTGLLLLPFVWSIPEAMVTAELSAAFPEASGFVAWVSAAFGPYWGFFEGYWSYLSGVVDNSLYAVLFLDYLLILLKQDDGEDHPLSSGTPRLLFLLAVCVSLTGLNLLGLRIVGNVALAVCVFSLLPFVVMIFWGSKGYSYPRNWLDLPQGGWGAVQWGSFLHVVFWNCNYWDSAASFASEVENPGRSFPLAMALCVALVVFSNVFPILVATGVEKNPDYSQWDDGYFARSAKLIAGEWLSVWVVVAAAVSNIGLFEAEMSSDALQIMGMAERGMLPLLLATRVSNRPGASPLHATLISSGIIIVASFLDFSSLVEILNCLYAVAQLLEFAAYIHLRRTMPHLHRPWRIPLSTPMLCLMLAPAVFFLVVLIVFSRIFTLLVCLGLIALGFVLHFLIELARIKNWCRFTELHAYDSPTIDKQIEEVGYSYLQSD